MSRITIPCGMGDHNVGIIVGKSLDYAMIERHVAANMISSGKCPLCDMGYPVSVPRELIIRSYHMEDDWPEPIGLNDYGQPVDKWYHRSGHAGPSGRPERNKTKSKMQKDARKRNRK